MQFSSGELEWAAEVVGRRVPPTPQYVWPLLADNLGAEVWVKHENHTPTGAFKVRGGLVYAERLRTGRPGVKGIVSATRGNPGQGLRLSPRTIRIWCSAWPRMPGNCSGPPGNSTPSTCRSEWGQASAASSACGISSAC